MHVFCFMKRVKEIINSLKKIHRCCPANPFNTISCVSARVMRGAEFYPGCRVLARSERDGLYYLGTIIGLHQVQKKENTCVVMTNILEYIIKSMLFSRAEEVFIWWSLIRSWDPMIMP